MKSTRAQIVSGDCERVYASAGQSLQGLAGASITVTGGTGFMGAWILELIAYLNARQGMGITVTALARDSGRLIAAMPHIAHLPWLCLQRNDVRTLGEMPKNTSHIIHAAGDPDSRSHASRPVETMRVIAEGAAAVIAAAQRLGHLRQILNVSSGNIPHTGTALPGDLARTVSAPYVEAKRYAETLFQAARSELRLPVVQVRPYSFLGPYQQADAPWAANAFLRDAMCGRAIRILGDGESIRTVMYGADLAMWMLVMLEKGRDGMTYSVGADTGHSMKSIAQAVADQFHPRPAILLNCALAGAPTKTCYVPDLSAVRQALNLRTYTDLATAVAHYQLWLEAPADA
jgi:dTDP-glucose 4,6-dehydratase